MTLAVRLEDELERQLAAVARIEGRTKSDVVRDALRRYLDANALVAEARRQSEVVSAAEDDADVLRFIEAVTDLPAEP